MDIKGSPNSKIKARARLSDIRPVRPKKAISKKSLNSNTPVTKNLKDEPASNKIDKSKSKTVQITLSLPKNLPTLPKFSELRSSVILLYEKAPKKKIAKYATISAGVIIAYFAVMSLLHQFSIFVDAREGDFDSVKVIEKPNFGTMLPNGKAIDQFGGWKRVSPPKSEPVFAYVDTISDIKIQVSQQKVPEKFKKGNIDEQIKELALGFGAKDTVKAGGLILHIGQTFEGQQSVIFRKNDLMFLIKSESKITNNAWGKYALSLR